MSMGLLLSILTIMLMGAPFSYAQKKNLKISTLVCPKDSQKTFFPDAVKPLWVSCRDKDQLYQGFLIQLSNSGEVLRIAAMKNSLRHGKEIRFGASGFLEERSYLNGHLTQDSYIYKSESVLGRIIPDTLTPKDWQSFDDTASPSILGTWLKQAPVSIIHFDNGRMSRLRFGKKDYEFEIKPEGRIFAKNHPELKGMFFVDPIPMWNLSSDDLRRELLPGFGSCKKYSGPISRFGRHYDHLLYVRQPSQAKHLQNLIEIRNRFINFCVPEDIRENLGMLECPPQLPQMFTPDPCLVPISDQLKVPYEPKYFKFEWTMGKSPEEFVQLIGKSKLLAFMSNPNEKSLSLFIPPKTMIILKKYEKKIKFRVMTEHSYSNRVGSKDLEDKDWWDWHPFPGGE